MKPEDDLLQEVVGLAILLIVIIVLADLVQDGWLLESLERCMFR